jgi:hypothetical protein
MCWLSNRIAAVVKDPDAERENVFNFDWYDVFPPSIKDLEKAWSKE